MREDQREIKALWVEVTPFGSPYLRKILNYKYRIRHKCTIYLECEKES